MSDVIALSVNGAAYDGWETVTVNRNIDALAASFDLSISSRWSIDSDPVPIRAGDACTIKINGVLVLTGYIDDFTEDESPESHTINVSGRAKTGDLVDCSAILPDWQLRQKKIEDIAAQLCDPFGISVDLIGPNPLQSLDTGEKIKIFRVDQGESVHDALIRLVRQPGLLLSTSPAGNLQLSRASTIPTAGHITRGVNTKGGRYSSSVKDRFQQYLLKSQTAGDDDTTGAAAGQLQEIVEDDDVTRYRPLLVLAETPRDRRSLKTRAKWERNQRAASSERISYQMQGWVNAAGDIWGPNMLVPVTDTRFGIQDTMLVSGAVLSQTVEGGTVADVEVTGPEAYNIFNPPKRRRTK